jgi:hypothetical protein
MVEVVEEKAQQFHLENSPKIKTFNAHLPWRAVPGKTQRRKVTKFFQENNIKSTLKIPCGPDASLNRRGLEELFFEIFAS